MRDSSFYIESSSGQQAKAARVDSVESPGTAPYGLLDEVKWLAGDGGPVTTYIDAFQANAAKEMPYSNHMVQAQRAFELASQARNLPGGSTNMALKSAEDFLYGQAAAESGDLGNLLAIHNGEIYNAVKLLANVLPPLEYAMRSNKANPMSRPGLSFLWAKRGMNVGLMHALFGVHIEPPPAHQLPPQSRKKR